MPTCPFEIPGLLPIYDGFGVLDFARVDFDDWERFRGKRLKFVSRGYVVVRGVSGKRGEYLHRLILGLQPGVRRKYAQTDHINRDPTDNRKSNLRVVTAKENCANRSGIYEKAA